MSRRERREEEEATDETSSSVRDECVSWGGGLGTVAGVAEVEEVRLCKRGMVEWWFVAEGRRA